MWQYPPSLKRKWESMEIAQLEEPRTLAGRVGKLLVQVMLSLVVLTWITANTPHILVAIAVVLVGGLLIAIAPGVTLVTVAVLAGLFLVA